MSLSLLTENGPLLLDDGGPLLVQQTVRDSVLAAVVALLTAAIPEVTVERARRAPPAEHEMPMLVVTGTSMSPDITQAPHLTEWTVGFTVEGYVSGDGDLAAEQASSMLHARVMEVLETATLGESDIMTTAGTAEMGLYGAQQSKRAIGEFSAPFTTRCWARSGYPYIT